MNIFGKLKSLSQEKPPSWEDGKAKIDDGLKALGLDGGLEALIAEVANQGADPAITPVNPAVVLNDIANAITQAEKALNAEQLLIVSGLVEAKLAVEVKGVSGVGAIADIRLEIAPRNN